MLGFAQFPSTRVHLFRSVPDRPLSSLRIQAIIHALVVAASTYRVVFNGHLTTRIREHAPNNIIAKSDTYSTSTLFGILRSTIETYSNKLAIFKHATRKRIRGLAQKQHLKRWPTHNRDFVDRRFLEVRGALLQKETDILEEVFVDFESSIPSWDTYVVRKFFRNYKRDVTRSGQHQARAKLDSRGLEHRTRREYPEWLAPSDLYHFLNAKVCVPEFGLQRASNS